MKRREDLSVPCHLFLLCLCKRSCFLFGLCSFLLCLCQGIASSPSLGGGDFQSLMGSQTPHWKYVHQPQDIDLLQWIEALYKKNQHYQFADEGSYKIPRVVHFIWLGPKPFPPYSVENIRTWMAHHPDWTFKFWTDRDREPPCKGMQVIDVSSFSFVKLQSCYEASQNFGEKSDLLRYEILFQEGGVYADHDANSIQAFDGLHRGYDFYCCLETPHEPFVGRNITCGNGVLGSRPAHPCVGKVIDIIAQNWEMLGRKYRGKDPHSQTEIVMQRTYIALTLALREGVDLPGNVDIVFPASYFFAKSGMPSLYSKHFYATAWDAAKPSHSPDQVVLEKQLNKLDQKSMRLQRVLILLLCLMFGVCVLLLKAQKGSTRI